MPSVNFVMPFRPAFESNSIPVAGALVHFYYTGTLTPAPVYTNSALTTVATNPIVANGVGRLPQTFMNDAITYRVRVTEPDGTLLEEYDPYTPRESGADGEDGEDGAPGASFADLARTDGTVWGVTIPPDATDDEVLELLKEGFPADYWPYLGSVSASYPTTSDMVASSPANGDHAIVYADAGTWTGYLDAHVFPAKGRYTYDLAHTYWHWARTLDQAAHDARIDAIYTADEAAARSNQGLTNEIIGQEVTGTINSMGSGVTWWQRWDLTNVTGDGILQVRQNGASWFDLSGEFPEIILWKSGSKSRMRAVAHGWQSIAGTGTSDGEPATLFIETWSDPAHIGSGDASSVIEKFYANGTSGRHHTVYPAAWVNGFTRMELEGTPGYAGYLVTSCYESGSALGVTWQIGNSGQATQYAGESVSRSVLDLANFQGSNGLWLATFGTQVGSTRTTNGWIKSDGLSRWTSVELPEATPGNPAANSLRLYAKDVAGITRLAYRDSAGTETVL